MPHASAQLRGIVDELEGARARLHALAAGRPREAWAVRPAEGSWSAAECIEHLNLTARAYLPILARALEEARALGAPPPGRYRRDVTGWLLSLMVGPVPSVGGVRIGRVRTPAPFEPEGALALEEVVAEFDRLQDEQVGCVRAAEGLPLGRVRIHSPFAPNVGYTLWSCFVILPRHQRRHLQQAEAAWRT